jgi:hypothetical protein
MRVTVDIRRVIAGGHMLFWPIVLALGPGFVAVYYDHDVSPFARQAACERTLSRLTRHAKQESKFVTALRKSAGAALSEVKFYPACIDRRPQEFEDELKNRNEIPEDETQIKI